MDNDNIKRANKPLSDEYYVNWYTPFRGNNYDEGSFSCSSEEEAIEKINNLGYGYSAKLYKHSEKKYSNKTLIGGKSMDGNYEPLDGKK